MGLLREWRYYIYFWVVKKVETINKMKISRLNKSIALMGGTILDPINGNEKKGNVHIVDGKIKSIANKKPPKSATIIDCKGLIITHGFCDIHSHFREPGREDKETLESGAIAALAGGFTRVCVMPNTDPPIDSPESIRYIVDRSEECPVYIHPIGAISKNQHGEELTEMALMISEGAVAFSDDGLPVTDSRIMRNALEYANMLGTPLINHAEDLCLIQDGVMHEGTISTQLGLPSSPDLAESNMVHRDLELSELTGARLHVPHVSSAKSIDHIRKIKENNLKISAEVSPHHLFFTDEDLVTFDTNLKVAPPIRSRSDRKSLIKALKDGTIDCIATDHAPHTIEDKEATFDLAPFGMIGLESCFGAVYKTMVVENNMKRTELVKALTVNPRKIMGFDYDLLKIGKKAEITVFDPHKGWIFNYNNIYSKSKNSPFLDRKMFGHVEYTIVKGHIANNN